MAERTDPTYRDVVLERRLREALAALNPGAGRSAGGSLPQAARSTRRRLSPTTALHRIWWTACRGVPAAGRLHRRRPGARAGLRDPENNDWLAVNQFTVVEDQHKRRPDVVLFVNGLPLAVIELKNPADEKATIWTAFNQLQTYKEQIPSLFAYNEVLVISDGVQARIGTLTADREWFMPWRTIDGRGAGRCRRCRSCRSCSRACSRSGASWTWSAHFIVFEDDGGGVLVKKMAGYHQFHAVNVACETLRAAGAGAATTSEPYAAKPAATGDRRVGVVWHTQGSGKSLTMAFYAGRIVLHPAMENPTLVVLTDRNDLDDQLFGTFARCHELLRQTPVQAESREHLRELLDVASGGVVFTTIQKFFPEQKGDQHPLLSDRRNIVVIADEAHRSQYDFIDGFARHMRDALPNASFIGFTGTPIELTDKNTRAVFGDYISIYDIQRAVEDGATVPIYYESRLAKLELKESERPRIDPHGFDWAPWVSGTPRDRLSLLPRRRSISSLRTTARSACSVP